MSSVQHLKALINERLTAAAEEIFTEFEKTIVQYEEEIDRQRRLLEITWKAETHTSDLPQQHVCQKEEVLSDQEVSNQERKSSLDQEDPEPSQIQDKHELLLTSQRADQLGLKQRIDVQQQHICREEEVLVDQLLCYQGRNLSPDQKDPESAQIKETQEKLCTSQDQEGPEPVEIKEEQEELCTSLNQAEPEPRHIKKEHEELCTFQEKQQLVLKQDTDTFIVTSIYEESDHRGLDVTSDQLLVYNFPIAESPNCQIKEHPGPRVGVKPYACKTCEKSFSRHDHLLHHMRTHTGEKPYSCETCGKSFTQSGCLLHHIRTHTGEKPFFCNTCGKNFGRREHLLTHMRTHTGEKAFSCKACGKSFTQHCHLVRHMRTHTGEKPYSCETCGSSFSQRANLTVHMRIHTDDKLYSCETCGKSFHQRGNLFCHMMTHTGEKPYPCHTCGERFKYASSLKNHLRTHTGEKL